MDPLFGRAGALQAALVLEMRDASVNALELLYGELVIVIRWH